MASSHSDRPAPEAIAATVESIKTMLKVGGAFAVVGYLLLGAALVFELTRFQPLIEQFFTSFTETSLAGGSADPRGEEVNTTLTAIHQWPSTLMWLKLGGVGHILVGIFISLAAVVRALSIMPYRLGYALEQPQESTEEADT